MPNRSVLYELNVQLDTGQWGVSVPLDQSLIGPVAYGWDRFTKDPESMTFGGGLLAIFVLPRTDIWLGVGLMTVMGVLAGMAPAVNAMRLRITDALRRN